MALSSILIGAIGEGDEAALLCITDLIQCCRGAPGEGGAIYEGVVLSQGITCIYTY